MFAIALTVTCCIRCVYVHDNSPTGIKGQVSCVDTEEHNWMGLNSWKMGNCTEMLLTSGWLHHPITESNNNPWTIILSWQTLGNSALVYY